VLLVDFVVLCVLEPTERFASGEGVGESFGKVQESATRDKLTRSNHCVQQSGELGFVWVQGFGFCVVI
jgi:hypothetical protein